MMRRTICVLFGTLVLFFERCVLAEWSIQTQSVPEEYLQAIKVEFSKPVVEALLRFSGFHRKFGVPYLYVRSALTYATEIAKATANSPLFSSSEGIDDIALTHLLRMVLPSSPVYCANVNCAATTIGEILAEIITEGDFVTHRISDHAIKMYAGNLAGNILWRLSRLPDPDSHMSELLKDAPPKLVNDYAQFLRFLSLGIINSTLISEFCEDEGINADTSMILLNTVCGSRFLNFKLGLASDLMTSMLESYTFAKKILPPDLEFYQSFSVISSIVAETVTFGMIRQGYLKGDEDLKETSRDVLKMILLGITTSKMNLGSSISFVKYSSFKNKKVNKPSKSLKQTIWKKVSSELYDSEIFQRIFNRTNISSLELEEYTYAMAEGITHSVTNISEDLSTAITERFTETLSQTADSMKGTLPKDSLKIFSDSISKTLLKIASRLKVVDFNKNSSSVFHIFHEVVQSILSYLEKLDETISQREESVE